MKNVAVYILVGLGAVGYNAMTSVDRDDSGAIIDGGNVGAFDLRVGDCFDDTTAMEDGEIMNLPGVPCSDPHDNEVYALVDVEMAEWPGDDAMGDLAMDRCLEHFASFVGRDYETSSLDIYTMYPSKESFAQNDREVVCAVYDMELNKLQGSVQGTSL